MVMNSFRSSMARRFRLAPIAETAEILFLEFKSVTAVWRLCQSYIAATVPAFEIVDRLLFLNDFILSTEIGLGA